MDTDSRHALLKLLSGHPTQEARLFQVPSDSLNGCTGLLEVLLPGSPLIGGTGLFKEPLLAVQLFSNNLLGAARMQPEAGTTFVRREEEEEESQRTCASFESGHSGSEPEKEDLSAPGPSLPAGSEGLIHRVHNITHLCTICAPSSSASFI